jgi:hypothetical protein
MDFILDLVNGGSSLVLRNLFRDLGESAGLKDVSYFTAAEGESSGEVLRQGVA